MASIQNALMDYVGQRVLVIARDGRGLQPLIGTLVRMDSKVYAKYRVYEKTGRPGGVRQIYINPALVLIGDLQVVHFDGV